MKKENMPVILVIEDEDALSQALCDQLRREGYRPLCAADGQEGLKLALQEHPEVIILDLLMPTMDGMAVLEKLRQDEWGKHVPVVVSTNVESVNSINQCLRVGIHDYFVKSNVSLKTITGAVKDLLVA